ncbi:MAG: hypothetical protein J6T15_05265 [Bacilli bacterium]|nr:hypothetical protein [Bacilli bacterium]
MKKYIVFIQDEWNNNYLIGFYDELNEAVPEVNEFLETYNTKIDELKEYVSTFGTCFDTEVETPDENYIMIRGFNLSGYLEGSDNGGDN